MTVRSLRELLAIMARTPKNYARDTVLFLQAMDNLQEIIEILEKEKVIASSE